MLRHLGSCVHARPGESTLSGIGMIAIRNIAQHTDIFHTNAQRTLDNRYEQISDVKLSEADLRQLPVGVARYIRSLIVPGTDAMYPMPSLGPNGFDVSFFVNATTNTERVNVKFVDVPDTRGLKSITASKPIRTGEELLLLATSDPSEGGAAAYAGVGDDNRADTSRVEGLVTERSALRRRLKESKRMTQRILAQLTECESDILETLPPRPTMKTVGKVRVVVGAEKFASPLPGGVDLNKRCFAWFDADKTACDATLTRYFSADERKKRARPSRDVDICTSASATATRGCYLMEFLLDEDESTPDFDYVSDGDETVWVWPNQKDVDRETESVEVEGSASENEQSIADDDLFDESPSPPRACVKVETDA